MDIRMKDITKIGSYKEISQNLEGFIEETKKLMNKLKEKCMRDERNLTCFNILRKSISVADGLSKFEFMPIEAVGFFTRLAFEINVVTRYIIKSDENLKTFTTEALQDEIDIYKGIISFAESGDPRVAVLQEHIVKCGNIATKHHRTLKRPLLTGKIVDKIGGLEDYNGLYKFYCKYSHATSYSINKSPETTNSLEFFNILIGNAQKYLFNTYKLIDDEVKKQVSTDKYAIVVYEDAIINARIYDGKMKLYDSMFNQLYDGSGNLNTIDSMLLEEEKNSDMQKLIRYIKSDDKLYEKILGTKQDPTVIKYKKI